VVSYFEGAGLAQTIHILPGDSGLYTRGHRLAAIHDMKALRGFLPLARIHEVAPSIPAEAQFHKYVGQAYRMSEPEEISWEHKKQLWQDHRWKLAEEVGGTGIIWQRQGN